VVTTGREWQKIETCGQEGGRPSSSSGTETADNDDDYIFYTCNISMIHFIDAHVVEEKVNSYNKKSNPKSRDHK